MYSFAAHPQTVTRSATGALPYLATRPVTLSGFSGAPDTLREMVDAAQGDRGERSVVLRALVEEITAGIWPKDYVGEILAIRNFAAEHIRYINDPQHVELVKSPQTIAEEFFERGIAVGDCDDIGCFISSSHLQLGRNCQIVAVGFGPAGHYTHVFERCQEPRTGVWVICDPVAGTREREMARRATTWQIWSLDEPPSRGAVEER